MRYKLFSFHMAEYMYYIYMYVYVYEILSSPTTSESVAASGHFDFPVDF